MNNDDLFQDPVGPEGKTPNTEKSRKKFPGWICIIAAVLVLCLGAGLYLNAGKAPDDPAPDFPALPVTMLAQPQYPQQIPYPAMNRGMPQSQEDVDTWRECQLAQHRDTGYQQSMVPFWISGIRTFLGGDGSQNKVFSPANLYMALSMLAEVTDGTTRQEILTALGADSLDSLRSGASDLWNAQYHNDTATSMILANSLWLDGSLSYRQETLDHLSQHYYASSYAGTPGSAEMDQALQNWLNEQTGGLLEQQAKNVTLDPQTVMALASTLFYQAKWSDAFLPENTTEMDFFSPEGTVKADFMRNDRISTYYWGESFGAVPMPMENSGGTMWLIQPDEGITPAQLLETQELFDFLENSREWENEEPMMIHLTMPKFDISADLDLRQGLQDLGIREVFGTEANFSPLLDSAEEGSLPLALTDCSQAVRVATDEEGVTAAAYTVMAMTGACIPPEEELDFRLDHPFLFVIQSHDRIPLFAGIVNNP